MKLHPILLMVGAGTALAALPSPALADESRFVISVAKIDLSQANDRQALDRQIQSVAEKVCGEGQDFSRSGREAVERCKRIVQAQADVQLAALASGPRTARR